MPEIYFLTLLAVESDSSTSLSVPSVNHEYPSESKRNRIHTVGYETRNFTICFSLILLSD